MITVIYSNRLDDDCILLKKMWEGIPNVYVVKINPTTDNWENIVDNAIMNETDTLIFAGHGSTQGLLHPDFDRGEYIFHENNVGLVKAKRVICVWCNASGFCANMNLHSFSTSMYISNVGEAMEYCYNNYTQEQINALTMRFCDNINELIINNVPLDQWVMQLGAKADIENGVDMFNRQGLFFL